MIAAPQGALQISSWPEPIVLSFSPRVAMVTATVGAEHLVAHTDGAGGERLAGVVGAALLVSGSKGVAKSES